MKLSQRLLPLAAVLLSACANLEVANETELSATPETIAAAVAVAPPVKRFEPAKNISVYKAQVAQQIVEGHTRTFEGDLPPILKSIVVLELTLDREGRATRVTVMRSNGFKELERVALDSVKRAGAFPAPTQSVLDGRGNVRYLETWLFRDDGKFQLRSLVTKPQPGAERLASAQS